MVLKNNKPIFKIALLGLSLAMYIALSFVSIDLQIFKISFVGIPLIFISVLYGPLEGMLVAVLGELTSQLFSYGITVTTPLWLIPAVVRALIVGLMFKQKYCKEHILLWIITILVSGLAVTILNTLVIYLDAEIFEYPSQLTAIAILFRFIGSIATSVIYGLLMPYVFEVLIKLKKVEKKAD